MGAAKGQQPPECCEVSEIHQNQGQMPHSNKSPKIQVVLPTALHSAILGAVGDYGLWTMDLHL